MAKNLRFIVPALVAALAVPAVILAQPVSEDGISRAKDGAILHRRLPGAPASTGSGSGDGGGGPETPTFVYDPTAANNSLPRDLMRDGRSLPKPSTTAPPSDEEPVHTPDGLTAPKPSEVAKPAPLPQPGPDTVNDPSAPLPALGSPDANPSGEGPTVTSDSDAAVSDPAMPPPNMEGADAGVPGDVGEPSEAEDPNAPPNPNAPSDPNAPDSDVVDPRSTLGSEARPDRDTEKEGTLHYNEVFDPSIVPFKRNRALDLIGKDYEIGLGNVRTEAMKPIGNRLDSGREVFWGSLLLEARAGQMVPLPSVSPESNILSYEANPPQDVLFDRDEAGNYYATPSLDGRLRLVFVMDAPKTYFGRPLPSDATLTDIPTKLRPKVPRAILKEAKEVAKAIGVPEDGSYADTLNWLVTYFRGFAPGEPPPTAGSVYRDIALGKTGVCRHRAHGFVITAQSLGIPARYVFNEAHVFVEVWVPAGAGIPAGWLRIDLGGGADELQVHGAQGKTLHEGGLDPFTRPDAFDQAQAAGAENVTGLPRPAEAPLPEPKPGPGEPAPGPGESTAIARVSSSPELVPTITTLSATSSIVFRGEGLDVEGRVTTVAGEPLREGSVQLVLLVDDHGKKTAVAQLGGALVLDGEGRFTASVKIPPRQMPGSYELVAEFLGDGVHSPSVSP